MKFCKIIVCFLFAVSFAVGNVKTVSAEEQNEKSDEYVRWMQQAKQEEVQKSWLLALDSYYNALETWKSWEDASAAYKAYSELANIIESGMPGRGEFDKFSLYEGWKNLLVETEKYANAVFPYELYFGSFETIKLDLGNKSADYSVRLSFACSTRYLKTVGVVAKGYAKARQEAWTELPEKFPGKPLTNDSLWIETNGTKMSAFGYSFGDDSVFDNKAVVPYEGVFEIAGYDGSVFAESSASVIGSRMETPNNKDLHYLGSEIIFKNVPEVGIKTIDSGKAFVRLKSIKLIYGNVDLEYSPYGVSRNFTGGKRKDVFCFPVQMHSYKQASGAEIVFCDRCDLKEFVPPVLISGKKVHCACLNPAEVFKLVFGDAGVSFKKILNWHQAFSKYEACILCNELSRICFRTPVYYLNGSDALCDFMLANDLSNEKNIKVNEAANGFRMPTLEEVKKFLVRSGDKALPPVEDVGSLLTGEAFNYFSMDKSFENGACLMLYYLE